MRRVLSDSLRTGPVGCWAGDICPQGLQDFSCSEQAACATFATFAAMDQLVQVFEIMFYIVWYEMDNCLNNTETVIDHV